MTRIGDFLEHHTTGIHAAVAAYLAYLVAIQTPANVSIPIIAILALDVIVIGAQHQHINYLENKDAGKRR